MKRFVVALLSIYFLSGCLQTENSSSGDGFGPEGGSELFQEANAIIEDRCSFCHQHIGLNLMTEAELIATGYVVPGNPEASRIYYRLIGSTGSMGPKSMPTSGTITVDEVNLIAEWISQVPTP